jgi:hypothetical protein
VTKKPAHQHIRDWRVVQISVTIFLCYVLYSLTTWMIATPFVSLQTWHLAPITTAVPALIAGLFAIVNTIMKRNEKEE